MKKLSILTAMLLAVAGVGFAGCQESGQQQGAAGGTGGTGGSGGTSGAGGGAGVGTGQAQPGAEERTGFGTEQEPSLQPGESDESARQPGSTGSEDAARIGNQPGGAESGGMNK